MSLSDVTITIRDDDVSPTNPVFRLSVDSIYSELHSSEGHSIALLQRYIFFKQGIGQIKQGFRVGLTRARLLLCCMILKQILYLGRFSSYGGGQWSERRRHLQQRVLITRISWFSFWRCRSMSFASFRSRFFDIRRLLRSRVLPSLSCGHATHSRRCSWCCSQI